MSRTVPRSHCLKCDTCDGYPCLVHAKADAEVIAVRPALRHPNVSLLTNAEVVQLKTSPSGREVTEVVVSQQGNIQSYRGSIVVVAAGAANSARLLLMSANDRHPNGLANGSDQVGRNYMFHNSQAVVALSLERNLTVFQKTVSLNDFYFRDRDFDFPARQHPDDRQVEGPDVQGRRPGFRAGLGARRDRPPCGRFLAHDRGHSRRSRQPHHARRAEEDHPELHVQQ
jgi:choline dehydrogenase-like flavoprotein